MMANMTPGAAYDDSILGPGPAGHIGPARRGEMEMMFTPDAPAGAYGVAGPAGGRGGQGAGVQGKVQMLGGTLWE